MDVYDFLRSSGNYRKFAERLADAFVAMLNGDEGILETQKSGRPQYSNIFIFREKRCIAMVQVRIDEDIWIRVYSREELAEDTIYRAENMLRNVKR